MAAVQVFSLITIWLSVLLGVYAYLGYPPVLVSSNFAALVGLYRHVTRRQTPMWWRVARPGEEQAA